MGKKPAPSSIMRNLGAFVGHVMQGIKSDVKPAQEVKAGEAEAQGIKRETVQEETRETEQGRVILRRTVIEEIVVPKAEGTSPEPAKADPRV